MAPRCRPDWHDLLTVFARPGEVLSRVRAEWPGRLPPELSALVGVQQDPVWHPEWCAFRHTTHTLDEAADLVDATGGGLERRLLFGLAMLCHDMGKAVTTRFDGQKGRWVSPGHDLAGVPIARQFLDSLGTDPGLAARVLPLVRFHMTHCRRDDFSDRSVLRLARKLAPATVRDLLLVMEADCNGRTALPLSISRLAWRAGRLGVMDGV